MFMQRKKLKGIVGSIVISSLLLTTGFSATSEKSKVADQDKKFEKKENLSSIQMLDQGKWAPNTYEAIQDLINKYGAKSSRYKSEKKPYAIFDWDNTSIMNDTEEALFFYQIDQMKFNLTPEEFYTVIKTNIPDGPFSNAYKNNNGELVTLEAITNDLKRDYDYLYRHYKVLIGDQSLDEIRATDYFQDFKVKLYFLYEAIGDTYSTDISYPWVLYLFSNMSVGEVKQLAEDSNDLNLGAGISKEKLTSPQQLHGDAGVVSISHITGLRLAPEISNLMHTFQNNGIDVYVVSASMEEVVEVFASNPKYGYNLPEENVFGMRLKKESGNIKPVYEENYPITAGQGKTKTIINEIASNKGGCGPIFVAGDSNTDYEMLTEFKDTKLSLIINRVSGSKIGELSKLAASRMGKNNPKYVLQGRNENTGLWIPTESTIKLGTNEKVLLANH
ncbi:haloacid dehalogenase-like hydrolase [Neobacillus sp. SuZ13]|uniref:haloacid dehalogenase-like hydrolase n=1 Tax=Neobacillus sp. SuZ13 TaxID=3047875 RepID=UPI0024C0CB25|nr:haloacid dehalogenase-like hydrolase [Neobacillus sp. SuZ13]WHY67301.1 haloacid dehalogenase-like hydrolase [Neobacillus sp. SuZ13]